MTADAAAPRRSLSPLAWIANKWRRRGAKRKKLTWRQRLVGWFTGARFMALVLLVGLWVLHLQEIGPVQSLQLATFDVYQKLRPRTVVPVAPLPGVVIVDIDELSLEKLGQWPWPRIYLSDLVNNLLAFGAGPIGFDVFFTEEDRLSPAKFAVLTDGLPPEMVAQLKTMKSNDEIFADKLRQGLVVLGQTGFDDKSLDRSKDLPTGTPPALIGPKLDPAKCPPIYLRDGACDGIAFALGKVPSFNGIAGNFLVLDKAAPGHGVVTVEPEFDGIVRRVPAAIQVNGKIYSSLALDMLRLAAGRPSYIIRYDQAGLTQVVLSSNFSVPTDPDGKIYVNFRPHDPSLFVSAYDVLAGTVDPAKIAGKFVLVGTSAQGLQDIRATPLNSTIPGVEVHANILETILTKSYLNRTSLSENFEQEAALGAGLAMILLVPLLGALPTLILFLLLLAALCGYGWYEYTEHLTLIDVSYPAISTFALYLLLTFVGYSKTANERKQVRGAFAQYLSPALVEQLADNPDQLKLGGEMKDMTLLFCDVRGFTTISEQFKTDPQGLTKLINKFLTPMTDIILARKGTIDKYMGDCIMAFWNAPLDDADHARHACISALAMMDRLAPLNEEIKAEAERDNRKYFPINIGIGLNSGEVVVGNMGSNQRFDYSVLGDAVNLASRLEGQSKAYHVFIVIGDHTQQRAPDFASLELDLIAVKGKKEAVRIFTLLGNPEMAATPAFQTLKAEHDKMLFAYRAQAWDQCDGLLKSCIALDKCGMTGFYEMMTERVNEFRAESPGAEWDGVYRATSK